MNTNTHRAARLAATILIAITAACGNNDLDDSLESINNATEAYTEQLQRESRAAQATTEAEMAPLIDAYNNADRD